MTPETKQLVTIGVGAVALLALSFKKPRVAAAALYGGPILGSKGVLPTGHVSSPFGLRTLPGEEQKMHMGIDISAPAGTPVRSALAGVVVDVSPDGLRSNYGNVVMVQHTEGTVSMYAHLGGFAPGLHVGQVVRQGELLGYVGTTHAPSSNAISPHLHMEVHEHAATDATGRLIVNPETPGRYDPQAWLAQHGRLPSDS